ncbi:hypothetical protein E2C01_070458 [Portunus trituberculatus]|uniref:Uncharacterized protein n=1 Tax=Portunus trituberculatus TaxID=210409 RepID=A0A5B7I3K1_PORTR|nr:hypothetical protein [Portunus trituberculatus]
MTYIEGGAVSTRAASRRGTGQAAPIRVGCRCHTEGALGGGGTCSWRFGCGTRHSPSLPHPPPSHSPWHSLHSAQTGSGLVYPPAWPGWPAST